MSTKDKAVAIAEDAPQLPMSRFAALMATADQIAGSELERDLETLIGVPFVITRIVVREGVPNGNTRTNYMSLELTVADQPTLVSYVQRGKLQAPQAAMIIPDSQMVINDGGTGIYRQVMEYLEETKRIILPSGPDNGERGTTRFESHRDQWSWDELEDPKVPEVRFDQQGQTVIGWEVELACPRGLRKSDYTNDYGKNTTYYLA